MLWPKQISDTHSFQCNLFRPSRCCVTDWMSRESGVKGLKFTRGVCHLLMLSVRVFPDWSVLNRATLRLAEPAPDPLARDNKLWRGNRFGSFSYNVFSPKLSFSSVQGLAPVETLLTSFTEVLEGLCLCGVCRRCVIQRPQLTPHDWFKNLRQSITVLKKKKHISAPQTSLWDLTFKTS